MTDHITPHLLKNNMTVHSLDLEVGNIIRYDVPTHLDGILRHTGLQEVTHVSHDVDSGVFTFHQNPTGVIYSCTNEDDVLDVVSNFAVFEDVGEV